MALQLELQTLDREVQRPFEQIAKQFPVGVHNLQNAVLLLAATGTRRKVGWGSSTAVFTASNTSAQLTIAHGLGVTPSLILTTAKTPVVIRCSIQESAAADATNIFLTGFESSGAAVSISQNFYWLAIG